MVRHFIFDANFILVNEKLNLFDFEITTFPEGVMEYLQVGYLANDFFQQPKSKYMYPKK